MLPKVTYNNANVTCSNTAQEKGGRLKTMLKQERIKNGWTQDFVAKSVGISRVAIQKIETGKRKPSYDVLVKLLELFGYNDPRELFAEAPEPHNHLLKE